MNKNTLFYAVEDEFEHVWYITNTYGKAYVAYIALRNKYWRSEFNLKIM